MRILYLDLDTLRPDHLGCYGYIRNTSPNIDGIAKEGVRFNNYYCSDAPCLPSRTALMSGRFGIHTGVVNHGGVAADMRIEGAERKLRSRIGRESLPGFLRSHGFHTASISPFADRHSAWSFYAGFKEIHDTGKCGEESAEEVTPIALKWIEENAKEDNWFLHINYWDAHTPYRAPLEYGNPFEGEPREEWLDEKVLQQHRSKPAPHGAREINSFHSNTNPRFPRHLGELKTMEDVQTMIDNYDCGIRYMDEHLGMLFDVLKKQGVYDDLIIVISADHGENFGELALYGEHGTADYHTCRIPMIVRWPGGKKGYVDEELHYNLDLGPTIAELIKKEPVPTWDGESYAPTIMEGKKCGQEYLILSQCSHVCQRSVRFGPWIYIRTYHDGYHLFPNEMLFHVEEDPHEQNNMAEKRKDICKEGVYYLNQWHDDMMKSMEYEVDPLWTVMKEGGPYHARGHLPAYCKRLEETERGYAISELKKRHPQEFL